MRTIRIGKPTITEEAKRLVALALEEGRVSEGAYTERLESEISKYFGGEHAIVVNSGHSALVLALRAKADIFGVDRVVTSPITFISTVTAALQAGLRVICSDVVRGDLLMDSVAAADYCDNFDGKACYLPVHLFGYQAHTPDRLKHVVHDACEALGSKWGDGRKVGTGSIGCFSFYTSHVLGSGEMGVVITPDDEVARCVRSMKDQGRRHLRPHSHVDRKTDIPPGERYSHDIEGYNFRTTDLQSALILGNFPTLDSAIAKRREVVRKLNDGLFGAFSAMGINSPVLDRDVSYLAYPIVCDKVETRDKLLTELDAKGVETRPTMSLIPTELAVRYSVETPFGFQNAKDVHSRSLYISCHDSLTDEDVDYMVSSVKEVLLGKA